MKKDNIVTFELNGTVAILTLNRPELKNAYSIELSKQLSEALIECDSNDNIRAVVITGKGDDFSVGVDLSELKKYREKGESNIGDVGATLNMDRVYPFEIRKPVICAINGRAGGFGAAYPMSCDIRIVGRNTTLSFSFVRVGIVPELGATWTLPRLIGTEKAMELLITGRKLVGQEIIDAGLALKVVDDDKLLDEAMSMAKSIAQTSAPACVAHTKKILWQRLESPVSLKQAIIEDRDHVKWSMMLNDSAEGTSSFFEKRPPVWKDLVTQEVASGMIEGRHE